MSRTHIRTHKHTYARTHTQSVYPISLCCPYFLLLLFKNVHMNSVHGVHCTLHARLAYLGQTPCNCLGVALRPMKGHVFPAPTPTAAHTHTSPTTHSVMAQALHCTRPSTNRRAAALHWSFSFIPEHYTGPGARGWGETEDDLILGRAIDWFKTCTCMRACMRANVSTGRSVHR